MNVHLEKRRLFTWLIILLVIAFLTTTLLGYSVARRHAREAIVNHQLPLTGDSIYSEIQRDIIKPVFVSEQMAQNTFLRDWILAGEQNETQIVRHLAEIKKHFGAITAFYVSEKSRKYYYPGGILKTVKESEPADKWFFRVRDIKDVYETNVDLDAANKNSLTVFINYRVTDYRGTFLGVAGLGLSSSGLAKLVEDYETKFNRRIAFCDASGELTLAGNNARARSGSIRNIDGISSVAERVLNKSAVQTRLQYVGSDGITHLNSRYIPELKWYLLVEQDENHALKPLNQVLWLNVAIGIVATFAALSLVLLAVNRYQKRLEHMALTDDLTGLTNRQTGEQKYDDAVKNAAKNGEPLSLIVFDIDEFKLVNDHYGHLAGDAVIAEVARRVLGHIRSTDFVSRWGGEEFVVLLKNCGLNTAAEIAEKIRAAIAAQPFQIDAIAVTKTVSAGVAELTADENAETLFARADRALYRAKQGGRNRIERG
jgi:diguanylate cyclase (GGDEF)-like protein